MTAEPRVAVVLLNWNNYPDTKVCLDSLAAATYPDLRVVVVDNGSRDGSGGRLAAEYPQHTHVANAANLGFARGCNVGIRKALEDPQVRHVLLLNNDAEVTPGFLEPLVAAAEADPRVGAVSGKVRMYGDRLWYAGGHVRRWHGGVHARGFGEVDRGQYDAPEEVRFVTGGLMLIPRRVVEAVGPLPEEYFFGFEEYDYSLTLRRAGYRLQYEPRSVVRHAGDGSHSNWDPKYLYNSYRNKLILQRKHLPAAALTFPVWRRVFRAYARRTGQRQRERWVAEHAYTGQTVPPAAGFDFALDEAIRDHAAGVPLDEEALKAFDARWQARRLVPPVETH